MLFVGVTTRASLAARVFDEWTRILGVDLCLVGVDIPLGSPGRVFRDAIALMRDSRQIRGAVITTHKVSIYDSAADMFDRLEPRARTLEEVGGVFKRQGELTGDAIDAASIGGAFEALPAGGQAWAPRQVCILGCGGAALALAYYLLRRAAGPQRIIMTDVHELRAGRARRILSSTAGAARLEVQVVPGAAATDAIIGGLPESSLIVNATGLGKDAPGSPVSEAAEFPQNSCIWDLNYRGGLDFLRLARARAPALNLSVADGWVCFVHGWARALEKVTDVAIGERIMGEMLAAADRYRSPRGPA